MVRELAGKVAIVTGGASGIGRATAELFVEEGARVVIADVDAEGGEKLAATLGEAAAFKQTDGGDADQIQELIDFGVERFGGLDVMFNNAGRSSPRTRVLQATLGEFTRAMHRNPLAALVGTQRAARPM